jgi:hypothetical protein
VRDPTQTPWLVVVVMYVFPFIAAGLFGMVAFRRMTPLVYRCGRCHRDFFRAPHRAFPRACPHCRARDWNG